MEGYHLEIIGDTLLTKFLILIFFLLMVFRANRVTKLTRKMTENTFSLYLLSTFLSDKLLILRQKTCPKIN